MRFGLILPSFSFPDLDYAKAARLRDFATGAEARGFAPATFDMYVRKRVPRMRPEDHAHML